MALVSVGCRLLRCFVWMGVCLGLASTLGGCVQIFRSPNGLRARIEGFRWSDDGQPNSTVLSEAELQTRLMEFSDTYMEAVGYVMDAIYTRTTDPQLRASLLSNKVFYLSATSGLAAEPDPLKALLDMMILLRLQREAWALPSLRAQYGDGAHQLEARLAGLEREIWELGAQVFPAEARQLLVHLVQRWRSENPEQTYVAYTRLLHLPPSPERSRLQGYLHGPTLLRSVSDAVKAVDDARRTTERAIFVAERFPILMVLNTQLTYLTLASEPEVRRMLNNADGLTSASRTFAQELSRLPLNFQAERQKALADFATLIVTQRREALADFSGVIDAQRSALFADLDARLTNVNGSFTVASNTLAQATLLLRQVDETTSRVMPLMELTNQLGATCEQIVAGISSLSAPVAGVAPVEAENFEFADAVSALKELHATTIRIESVLGQLGGKGGEPALKATLDQIDRSTQKQVDHIFDRLFLLIIVFSIGLAAALTLPRLIGRREKP